MALYQTHKSPYWYVRLWDAQNQRYVCRSTKTEVTIEAIADAFQWAESYTASPRGGTKRETLLNGATTTATPTPSFGEYADRYAHEHKNKHEYQMIYRKEDGISAYFGSSNIEDITTASMREYYKHLNQNRGKPLSASTLTKHGIIIRKILRMALDERKLSSIPDAPKVGDKAGDVTVTKAQPRSYFTEEELTKLITQGRRHIGDSVRGVTVTQEHIDMIQFAVSSFVRPSVTELFGLRMCDIEQKDNPSHLVLSINGKTGKRVSVTMPDAVTAYENQGKKQPTDYLFMNEYENRATAISVYRRIFNHILDKLNLRTDSKGIPRTPYSLRHTGLRLRLAQSGGKVNIYTLAKNAGTSVQMLEKFYIKDMALNPDQIRNLHIQS